MEKLHAFSKKRPGADCGSGHEPLGAKFRLKLKKAGKTTRPFRCDLMIIRSYIYMTYIYIGHIVPYDYRVEEMNRLKGLDLTDRVPEELCTEAHNIVQEAGNKTTTARKQKEMQEGKAVI